ncbi:hypothetical protein TTHERM_00161430 (macronuclear) [Tetrahymena thermophila SB210]|uniref:Uncharacterized protein n=1 Tax=Tetrahymena thermophila (strain SB210) TaxID=312017 RepID=Q22VZ1_TETTS|nr:hypothetical protein TTHERM_00161430 [Tetrahymena thermophila SB210]EAR89625.2 hypothetical protein TTHERM_00161430 [Tetrahymena thermophila SB210]|eukprot:XP_001009871.2 hypothetical protein TTHERM_00161430 [Tetrahymena thermophila SB210]
MSEQLIDTLSQYSSVGSNYTDSEVKSSDAGGSIYQKQKRVSQSGLDLSVEQKTPTNFKMSIEVEKNLQRFSSLQENCSSINVKNKLKELIEQQYTIQIQNLIEELNQTKIEKAILEKKLQLQVKNQIDYISEMRQSIGNNNVRSLEGQSRNSQNISSNSISNFSNNQYVQVLEKLKSQETQQKELQFQVQELTTELKMAKISQSQYKKQIQKLNEILENSKDPKKVENKDDNLSKINELQKQLIEYKQKYESLQQQIKIQATQETMPDDLNEYQKLTQVTESESCYKNNILFSEQSQLELNNKVFNNIREVKYLANKFMKDEERPISYLKKNMNCFLQLDQLQRYKKQKGSVQNIFSNFSLQTLESEYLDNKENLNILQKQIEIEKFKKKVLDTDNNQLYNKLISLYQNQ